MKEKINDEIQLSNVIQDDSEPFYYAQHCHEGMLAFAYALDKTIRGKYLQENKILKYVEMSVPKIIVETRCTIQANAVQ